MSRTFAKGELRKALFVVFVLSLLLVCARWLIREREREKLKEVLTATSQARLRFQCFGGPSSLKEIAKNKDAELWEIIQLNHSFERRDFNVWGKDGIWIYFFAGAPSPELEPQLRLWIDWKSDEGWVLSLSGMDITVPKAQRPLEGRKLSKLTCRRVREYLRRDVAFRDWESEATSWRKKWS